MEQLDFFKTLEQTKPICPVCGNVFEKNVHNRKYCSEKCSITVKRISYKKWYITHGEERNKKMRKGFGNGVCLNCNNHFKKTGNTQKYCCKECQKDAKRSSRIELENKKCKICKNVLPISNFSLADKTGNRRSSCKKCYNEKKHKENGTLEKYLKEKEYVEELHMLQSEGKRRCRLCDKIKQLEDFHTSNSKKVFYNKKTYCKKCARDVYLRPYMQSEAGKQKKSKWDKKYASKPETAEKRNKKHMERYYTDVEYKLLITLRGRIKAVFKSKKLLKENKTIELLGCKVKEAIKHIEKQFKDGMTWDNHGIKGWHIDHIIPCASFDLTDPEQQKKCFHYTNLQPLWANENLSKGAKII